MKKSIRKEFPVFKKQVYLNFGSSGPMPHSVIKKINEHLLLQAKEGPSSPEFMRRYLNEYVELRNMLSGLLNVSGREVGITQNTTEGLNIILRGLSWERQDEIITTNLEHAGLKIPLERIKDEYCVKIEIINTASLADKEILNKLSAAINSRVKLIALSHVDYVIGRRMPVKEICALAKKENIPVLIDGAQAAGAIPVDLRKIGCDFYSFPAHKWLLGPRGMGCLFISKERLNRVKPVFTGWCSVNEIGPDVIVSTHKNKTSKKRYSLVDSVGRFAVSSWSTIGVKGFLESLFFFKRHLGIGLEESLYDTFLFKKELERIRGVELLTPISKEESAGIVSFRFAQIPSFELAGKLISFRAIVRYVPEADCVRCCVSAINNSDDLRFTINKIKKIVEAAK